MVLDYHRMEKTNFLKLARALLRNEKRFYWLVVVYGLAVSAMTLAIPVSVQVLISSVANTALVRPVYMLAAMLFVLLVFSSTFAALQVYVMELFERRFFQRVVSSVAVQLIHARFSYLQTINRDELVNRYFDIMTVQKSLPPLLTGVLATITQMAVGLILTSFYHPVFVVFNVFFVLLCWVIWRAFDRGAVVSAIRLSKTKYSAAEWLEGLARCNSFYKSARTTRYALKRTRDITAQFVTDHRTHFNYNYPQVVGYLLLYAVFSAALLGVGGYLVIHDQLTLGQLVAAELVLVAVYANVARLGYYLELYYDLYAALEKLSHLFEIPLEPARDSKDEVADWGEADIVFSEVHDPRFQRDIHFDFVIKGGRTVLVAPSASSVAQSFTDLLIAFRDPVSGQIKLGDHDLLDVPVHQLREQVHVIDSLDVPDCPIETFLRIADPDIGRDGMRTCLSQVALDEELSHLPEGLDQPLTTYGYPLSPSGIIKLKLAFAMLSRPKVLVLTTLFDVVSTASRQRILHELRQHKELSVVWLSNRRDVHEFDDYWLWTPTAQTRFDSLDALNEAEQALIDQQTGTVMS